MKTLFAAAAVAALSGAASGQIFLNFEGICPPNNTTTSIGAFYAGLGVFFTGGGSNALALVDADEGGNAQGNFANEPSSKTIMFFLEGNATIMNVPGGFDTGFATYYSTIATTGTLEVYDGLDGTGNLLGSAPMFALGSAGNGDPTGAYDTWDIAAVIIGNQVARSVVFIGAANFIGFDDMVFGDIPAPGAASLLGLAALAGLRRRR